MSATTSFNCWEKVCLGDVVTLINGRAYKQPEMLDEGTPILRIQNLNGGNRWFFSDLNLPREKYCEKGDLLYAWSATFGPYLYQGPKAIFHYHIWNVIPSVAIDKRFAYYELLRVTNQIKAAAHGVAMPHITKAGMESWPLLLPPLAEQQRIADKLDTVLARVDAVNDRLARVAPLLKRFRQSVLAAATSGRLTADWRRSHNLAFNWETVLLKDLCTRVTDGEHISPTKTATGIPLLTAKNVTDNGITFDGVHYVSEVDAERFWARCKPEPNDILICSRGTIGRAALIKTEKKFCLMGTVILLKPKYKRITPNYLHVCISSPGTQAALKGASGATAVSALYLRDIAKLEVQLPSDTEQTEIVRRVDILLAFANRLEARLQAAQTASARLTPALLAKAFRGELVPQDPNDEPAAELLKRLAQSKPEPTKKPRARKATT